MLQILAQVLSEWSFWSCSLCRHGALYLLVAASGRSEQQAGLCQAEMVPVPFKAGDALLVENVAAAEQDLFLHTKVLTAY